MKRDKWWQRKSAKKYEVDNKVGIKKTQFGTQNKLFL